MNRPAYAFRAFQLAACLAFALTACGGGSSDSVVNPPPTTPTSLTPADLAVLFAEGDGASEAIGRAYQQARGIPEANIIRVAVDTRAEVIGVDAFNSLKVAIDARLPATVQTTLVTWARPSRVMGSCAMGITSALALGYEPRYCGGCAATPSTA